MKKHCLICKQPIYFFEKTVELVDFKENRVHLKCAHVYLMDKLMVADRQKKGLK